MGSGAILQPCNPVQNTYTCGIDSDNCTIAENTFQMEGGNGIVLRPSQIEDGSDQLRTIRPTTTFTSVAAKGRDTETGFSVGEIVGVGVGAGVPLLAALLASVFITVNQNMRIRELKTAAPATPKLDPGLSSPMYSHQLPPQVPNSAYGGFDYQAFHQTLPPQSRFQEVHVNELDGRPDPQELGSAKPRD